MAHPIASSGLLLHRLHRSPAPARKHEHILALLPAVLAARPRFPVHGRGWATARACGSAGHGGYVLASHPAQAAQETEGPGGLRGPAHAGVC